MDSLFSNLLHVRLFLIRIAILLIVFFVFCDICVQLTEYHDEELETVKYLPDITRLADLYRILKIDHTRPTNVSSGNYTNFVRSQIGSALNGGEPFYKKVVNDGLVRPFDPDSRASFNLHQSYTWCEEHQLDATWDDDLIYCFTEHTGLVATPRLPEDAFSGNGTLCGQKNMQSSKVQLLRRPGKATVFVAHDPLLRFFITYLEECGPKLSEPIDDIDSEFVCYLCPRMGVDCVVQNIHSDMKLLAEGYHLPAERMPLTSRFFPQNWLCNLQENFDRYDFVRYQANGAEKEVAQKELLNALKTNNVKKTVEQQIVEMLEDFPQYHRESATDFFSSLTEMSLVDLIETYYYDYILFGFPFPAPLPEEEPNVH